MDLGEGHPCDIRETLVATVLRSIAEPCFAIYFLVNRGVAMSSIEVEEARQAAIRMEKSLGITSSEFDWHLLWKTAMTLRVTHR